MELRERTSSCHGSTRRQLLKASGALAAGAAVGPLMIDVAHGNDALASRRRQTYRALVETVGSLPGAAADHSRAEEAVDVLATQYQRADTDMRQIVDLVLDDLESGDGSDAGFSHMPIAQRLDLIRSRLTTPERQFSAERTKTAVALAAAPFNWSGFRWDLQAPELWLRTLQVAGSARSCV